MAKTKLLSVKEVAERMGMSRMSVVRKIQKGEIPAKRVGRSYVIAEDQLPGIFRPITEAEKKRIREGVRKLVDQYGEVLKRLGKE